MNPGPLGLLGGTFDPVHFAHLRLAAEALDRLALDSVRWIPSGQPGHRGAPCAGVEHRLAMLRLAIANEPRFTLDEADALETAPTFTVNTLARLRAALGSQIPLVLIIGADQLLALDTWWEWKRLFSLAHIAVAQRPHFEFRSGALTRELELEVERRAGAAADLATTPASTVVTFGMTQLDISGSAIRAEIAAGRRPGHLLPDAVLDYIAAQHLYAKEAVSP